MSHTLTAKARWLRGHGNGKAEGGKRKPNIFMPGWLGSQRSGASYGSGILMIIVRLNPKISVMTRTHPSH
ncbi:MAG TPA: hypothetical protein DD473_26350, partial [Planctomycetaceae bacterium]|nr:hypothetical protein [Planctomycetaceae bacterium]